MMIWESRIQSRVEGLQQLVPAHGKLCSVTCNQQSRSCLHGPD